jgi:serine phosphatase RsbU (regulator of sigma subunit)
MDKSKILVVDDDRAIRYYMEALLKRNGFSVITAGNGIEAIEIVKNNKIDLILMDIMMPGMDGFEATRRILEIKDAGYIPIIFLTAKARDVKDVIQGLKEGAVEYLNKPVDADELLARVKSMLRIKHLNDKNIELLNKVLEQQKLMDNELDIAKRVQTAMLPSLEKFAFADKCKIEVYYNAHVFIGGDMYDFLSYGKDRLGVVVADVSGHGPSAAMIMAILKTLLINESNDLPPPSILMERLNKKLFHITPHEYYVTLCLCLIDFSEGTLRHISAGHPSPFIFSKEREDIIQFKNYGLIAGMFDSEQYTEEEINVKKGDRIFLYSDGIFEVFGKDEKIYGFDRLKEFLKTNRHLSNREIIEKLVSELNDYWDKITERDDEVIVLIEIL